MSYIFGGRYKLAIYLHNSLLSNRSNLFIVVAVDSLRED